jgi:cytochrome bd-type quinol oxidase subunit 2
METQKDFKSAFKKMSKIASVFSIVVGAVVLFGWTLDITALKSVLPNFVTMKANTALGFVLAGLSLWLLQEGEVRSWKIYGRGYRQRSLLS